MRLKRVLHRIAPVALGPLLKRLGYAMRADEGAALETSGFYKEQTPFSALLEIHRGYLSQSGWLESKAANKSVRHGELVPWITFPAIAFLETLNLSTASVLEFGSGASTHWFTKRCKSVVSWEFDPGFFNRNQAGLTSKNLVLRDASDLDLTQALSSRKSFVLTPRDGELLSLDISHAERYEGGFYIKDISRFVDLVTYDLSKADLVMVDGGPRNLIASLVAQHSSKAIVIVDNTDIPYLANACEALRSAGFVEIPFEGLGPLNAYMFRTSCFIRDLAAIMN